MIISVIGQKGGTGKTTIARKIAVEFAKNDWGVHVADLDRVQQTFFKWAERRQEIGQKPAIEVALYAEPKAALKAANNSDVLIIDGKAFADTHAQEVALNSDLIVIPVGIAVDDLEPTLKIAVELVNKGISKDKILFVVCKVPENGDREAMQTRTSIQNWGFDVAQGWVPMKSAYSQAMDKGLTLTETPYQTLNERADKIIQQVFDKALKQVQETEEA